ncbi:hypothetical protein MKZ38_008582 [Zalerion maritima]|uniref:Uncharacterized protein n=1 Tax=Zalerion maritima TaxID=339359 RepID=A0AAD5RYT1_9PEZI|nr:hypothetical protein MKZ38_008582 [Zalerion maritima]
MPTTSRPTAARKTAGELNLTSLQDIERERSRIKKARMDARQAISNNLESKLGGVEKRLADKIAAELASVKETSRALLQGLYDALEDEDEKKMHLLQLAEHIQIETHNFFLKLQPAVKNMNTHPESYGNQ